MVRDFLAALGIALLATVAGTALPPGEAAAQSRGTSAIRGTVTTAAGTPIPGAQARLARIATGDARTAVANERGEFLFLLLPPGGPYVLRIEALGYADRVIEGLQLRVGQVERVDAVLAEQALTLEGIQVEVARADVFDPGRVGPSTLVSEAEIEGVPLISRNLVDLATLSPLVKATEGGGFSVLGQNDRYNAVLVDGLWNKDAFGLTAGGAPGGQAGAKLIPLDAVQQYEILVAPYDVRLSGFTGGALNAVTRAGTNDLRVQASGVFRDAALTGSLHTPTGTAEASGVGRALVAASVGGALIRDRAHFFVAGEFERRTRPPLGYTVGRDDPFLTRLTPDAADVARAALEGLTGRDPGTARSFALERRLFNVFARVDWRLSDDHRLTVRNNLAGASAEDDPNRLGFDPYGLASNRAERRGFADTFSAQLLSTPAGGISNDLTVQVQVARDETEPVSDLPQMEVDVLSSFEGAAFLRPVRSGAPLLTQDNVLRQTQVRLTDVLTWVRGTNTLTVGVSGAWYGFSQRYLPGAVGEYRFADTEALIANDPTQVQWSELLPGEAGDVAFDVTEWGGFVQNEFAPGDGLTMRIGVRIDVPWVLDRPPLNRRVWDFFGYRTDEVPSGHVLISPRWGFNWQTGEERTTQVRGGLGLFTGQIPFVWLADAFHNSGLRSVTKICSGRTSTGGTAPSYRPGDPPPDCAFGRADERRNVTVFDPAFRYPQDLRFSVGVDREVTDGWSASLGVLYNRAINQVVVQELNIDPIENAPGPLRGFGGAGRGIYGESVPLGRVPNPDVWNYARPDPQHDHVLLAQNASDDEAFAVTAEVRGEVEGGASLDLGYTYSVAIDRMSLVATDMVANYGSTPIRTAANRLPLARSDFHRPHKVVLRARTTVPGLDRTRVSVVYTGQSGAPFSYVYGGVGDLNGDGYAGPGAAFERYNDLFYVVERATELPNAGFATYALLDQALASECLRRWKGRIMERNGCRAPWQNRLDLRLAHALDVAGATVRLEADVVNVLNLMNGDWGRIRGVRTATPILDLLGRTAALQPENAFIRTRWAGASYRDAEGTLRPDDPWYAVTPDSQWQIQIGARVAWGGGS